MFALIALAHAVECPEGQAAVGEGCVVLAGEIIAAVPPEVLAAVFNRITAAEGVRQCLAPVADAAVRLDLLADVRKGVISGVAVAGGDGVSLELGWCVAQEVAKVQLPADPGEYRVAIPLHVAPTPAN